MNMTKFNRINFELGTIVPPYDPTYQSETVCDKTNNQTDATRTNILAHIKTDRNLFLYTYDLVVMEERYNVLTISNGVAGLDYMR